ncbi:MAG: metallophosphoesterase [Candidatus Riflebacteria bacterium]|nr:metallophosphoesterase [Candidatus Riflebacteria bacterium]
MIGRKIRFLLAAIIIFHSALVLDARDWSKDPARVDIPFAPRVAAIGDVHGAFPEFTASLEAVGMAKAKIGEEFKLEWIGGDGVLVLTGDFTDRGKYTKQVYDAVMDLEIEAEKAGGRVIALFGNHEALLLNGTTEKWAKTLKPPKQQCYQNTLDSFINAGLDFHQAISPEGKYGSWIRRRPIFAVVNNFLFVHGGCASPSQTLSNIAADFRDDMEVGNLSKGIFMNEAGPLWNRKWWDNNSFVQESLQKMGVRGVIFGHTIGALGNPGSVVAKDKRLISIDIGMCPFFGNSKGGGLLITAQAGGQMTFVAKYPDRPQVELFQVPTPVICPKPLLNPSNETLPRTGTMN